MATFKQDLSPFATNNSIKIASGGSCAHPVSVFKVPVRVLRGGGEIGKIDRLFFFDFFWVPV